MQTISYAACILAMSLCTAANAEQDYINAIPDLAKIECSFQSVQDPPIAGIAVEIRQVGTEERNYWWLQDDFPPLPIHAIFSHPMSPDTALTTVASVDVNGEIGMISYQPSGQTILSKHYKTADHVIRWTAQKGTCTETKGS